MKKKTAAILLTAVLGASMLSGCGSGQGNSAPEDSSTQLNSVEGDSQAVFAESSQETASQTQQSQAQQTEDGEEAYDGRLVSAGFMDMDYAEGFSIELFEGGYRMLTVGDPAAEFLVVPEGMSVPQEVEESVTILKMPMERVYIASTGMVSLMNAIDALDCIRLVATDADGWYIDEVKAAMGDGRIAYSGNYNEPDYEMMVEQDIQFYIDNAMIESAPEVIEKFEELGIPNLVEISSKESHPLARVEWVKLMGVLFDREAEAQEYFEAQKALMEQATAAESSGITVAMGYITSSGKCYARKGGDYLVQMIGLAGGEYVCADLEPEKSGNASMTFEEWYAAFKDADYFFYWNLGNKFYSLEEMTEYEPLFADFKAVKEGHVWITSPDFTQATSAISSIVADMNTILFSENPDEVTTDHLIRIPQKAEE